MFNNNGYASLSAVAKPDSIYGWQEYTFTCRTGINYIANDSSSNSLYFVLDKDYGSAGEIEIKAGETVSDFMATCMTISVRTDSGEVPFRALGV